MIQQFHFSIYIQKKARFQRSLYTHIHRSISHNQLKVERTQEFINLDKKMWHGTNNGIVVIPKEEGNYGICPNISWINLENIIQRKRIQLQKRQLQYEPTYLRYLVKLIKTGSREFPGCSVVRTPCSHCQDSGTIHVQGTKMCMKRGGCLLPQKERQQNGSCQGLEEGQMGSW